MDVDKTRLNGILVVEAWKRVDGTNAGDFEKALRNSVAPDDRGMVIDCEHLTYMSSAGLRVILLMAKMLRKQQAGFAICFLSGPIREVFEISGFDKIIAIHGSRADAISALGG